MRALLYILIIFGLGSCEINYKFNDAQVTGETAFVQQFLVQAPLSPPSAGQVFSESLQDIVQSQSKLELVQDQANSDISFQGVISYYEIRPEGVQQNDVAAQNRLTIRVDVIYENKLTPDENFSQSFTRFANYQSSVDINAVQDELLDEIFEQISQDVFNRAFGTW